MKNPKNKIIATIIITAGCIAVFFLLVPKYNHYLSVQMPEDFRQKVKNPVEQKVEEVKSNISGPDVSNSNPLPAEAKVSAPFLVQAPNANWDQTHEEACEEASLLIVKHFEDKTQFGDTKSQDKEILDLISYEEKNGYGPSITLNDLNNTAADNFGMKTGRVEKNVTVDDIKKEVADGKPVIVGAAGKILPNPNFRNGGPNYHMLVIIGYDKNGFITNDPGTRKGEGFRYSYDGLFNAIHDWDKDNILNGEKNYLVFD